MLKLIETSVAAHGGLDRWNEVDQISATFVPDGIALVQRGQEAFAKKPTRITARADGRKVIFDPFLEPGQRGIYEPHRTAVEAVDGTIREELANPRASFGDPAASWSATQLLYFAGCALSTYLTLPFALLDDGVRCEDAGTWLEGDESWHKVKLTFPESIVTMSTEQAIYIDETGLIRRHDYAVDIAGGNTTAHYLHDHQTFDGIVFPTRREIYLRGPDQQPIRDFLIITATLSDFELSSARA